MFLQNSIHGNASYNFLQLHVLFIIKWKLSYFKKEPPYIPVKEESVFFVQVWDQLSSADLSKLKSQITHHSVDLIYVFFFATYSYISYNFSPISM